MILMEEINSTHNCNWKWSKEDDTQVHHQGVLVTVQMELTLDVDQGKQGHTQINLNKIYSPGM